MDYRNKLKNDRFRTSTVTNRDFNEEMESDRGRAINSAAVRRLQQKTQVFPLEANAAVRSRLTHSLEVQQVGRYISKLVLKKLKAKDIDVSNFSDGFVSAVEVACLLHDIGNPPFGHFGEEAISIWAKKIIKPKFEESFPKSQMRDELIKDICNFEGNAQALRLLHQLQKLNLTYTQLACLLKYTRGAYEDKPIKGDEFFYRKKKPGFYWSEKSVFKEISEALSISEGCRFPLTYIMEAADDISYCIADIDDAVDKGILSIEKLDEQIKSIWSSFKDGQSVSQDDEDYLVKLSEEALKNASDEKFNDKHAYILTLRTRLVNDLAEYAADRYVKNHEAVYEGRFDQSLLDGNDIYNRATETLRELAVVNVFNHKSVQDLELKGYSVIKGILDTYSPLIDLEFHEFRVLIQGGRLKSHLIENLLFSKLSNKHKAAYLDSVKDIYARTEEELNDPDEDFLMLELYYRSRLIIDYVSGMTDGFALEEYMNLSASK